MRRLIRGDALEVLDRLDTRFTCLIADPPDNIGLEYDGYEDKMDDQEYIAWLLSCIARFTQYADIIWVSFNAKWWREMGCLMTKLAGVDSKLFIQTFTFGQNRKSDCGNGYRPLLRLMRPGAKLYPDTIKVPSWRQLNGDKRAAPGGKVPLDVWEFPRITGNCKERRSWHPTQLREGMIDRMVKLSTQPGDSVCDVFSGTGTVLRAVKDRDVTSIELCRTYCEKIAGEHDLEVEVV